MDLTRIDPWLFIAGLGFFLFGMQRLEAGLRAVSGDALERVLQRSTGNPFGSILVGIFATTVLQSSSLVSLMVLAFVGAGVLQMRNAVGVILGSNLGTTFTGWLVTAIGFKLNLDQLALPLLAFGTLGVVFLERRRRGMGFSTLILGLGLLLFGLGYMKTSVDEFAGSMDLAAYAGAHPYWFFGLGFVFAAVIQSSSATMMITLSALDAGIISLPAAAGIAIGADLGTTSTVMLAGARGSAAKRQVALAHFLFNVVTDFMALFVLLPMMGFFLERIGLDDPLFGLVAFHSFFNVIGIALFLPFVGVFANFLEGRFRRQSIGVSHFLGATPPEFAEPARQALESETRYRLSSVLANNERVIDPNVSVEEFGVDEREPDESYTRLKQAEGEAMDYARATLAADPHWQGGSRVTQLLEAFREAVYARKELRDIEHNWRQFLRVQREPVAGIIHDARAHQHAFYQGVQRVLESADIERMAILENGNADFVERSVKRFYADEAAAQLSDLDSSSFLNLLREIDSSNRALIRSLQLIVEESELDLSVVDDVDDKVKTESEAL